MINLGKLHEPKIQQYKCVSYLQEPGFPLACNAQNERMHETSWNTQCRSGHSSIDREENDKDQAYKRVQHIHSEPIMFRR